jgi:hypothetical protein
MYSNQMGKSWKNKKSSKNEEERPIRSLVAFYEQSSMNEDFFMAVMELFTELLGCGISHPNSGYKKKYFNF